jgi:Drosophila Retinin like protein
MFKLVVLSCLVSVAFAGYAPVQYAAQVKTIVEPHYSIVETPTVNHVASVVKSIPTATSYQSQTQYHSKNIVEPIYAHGVEKSYISTPVVKSVVESVPAVQYTKVAYAEPIVAKAAYVQSPVAYSAYAPKALSYASYAPAASYSTYSAPSAYQTYSAPAAYETYSAPAYSAYSAPAAYETYSAPAAYQTYAAPSYSAYASPAVYSKYAAPASYAHHY